MSRCKPHPLCKEQRKKTKEEPPCVWNNARSPGGGSLTVYLRDAAQAMPNALRRPVVVVVPGGGYNHVSAREADPVALQFAAAGYHTAILTYGGRARGITSPCASSTRPSACSAPVRKRGTCCRRRSRSAAFPRADTWLFPAQCSICQMVPPMHRPNAVLLAYPVITAGEFAHRGSFVQLAGSRRPLPPNGRSRWRTRSHPPHRRSSSGIRWRTRRCPWKNTLLLLTALRRAGVPCEAHLFEKGRHGTSISTAEVDAASAHRHHWVELALEWLGETFDFDLKENLSPLHPADAACRELPSAGG